jgi:predicted transposase YdaD
MVAAMPKSMMKAMERVNPELVVIEDLVKFGEDRGLKKGLKKGREQGWQEEERRTLRRVLVLRKLPLTAEQEAQIDACADITTLRRWHDQAIFAQSAAEALR